MDTAPGSSAPSTICCTKPDLERPRWKTLISASASEVGSEGVLFLTTEAGTFVLKSATKVASELYATEAAHWVGVASIHGRVIEFTKQEWSAIKGMLFMFVADHPGDEGASRVRTKLLSELDRAFWILMDFIPDALAVDGLMPDVAGPLLDPTSPYGARRLNEIGRIVALDMLLNNSDRVCAVWSNEGNATNILLLPDPPQTLGRPECARVAIAIDHSVTRLNPNNNISRRLLVEYCDRCRDFLQALQDESACSSMDTHPFARARDMLQRETLVDVGLAGCQLMAQGALQGAANVAQLQHSDLIALREHVRAMVTVDWADVWRNSCDKIDSEFLRQSLQVFHDAAAAGWLPSPERTASFELPPVLVCRDPLSDLEELANQASALKKSQHRALNKEWSRYGGDEKAMQQDLAVAGAQAPKPPPANPARNGFLAAIRRASQDNGTAGATCEAKEAGEARSGVLSAIAASNAMANLRPTTTVVTDVLGRRRVDAADTAAAARPASFLASIRSVAACGGKYSSIPDSFLASIRAEGSKPRAEVVADPREAPPLVAQGSCDASIIPRERVTPSSSAAIIRSALSNQGETVKVLVVQAHASGADDCVSWLDQLLKAEGGDVKFVLLPEGFMHESGSATLAGNNGLGSYAALAAQHSVYIIPGSFLEVGSDGTCYVTSVLLGPGGDVVGKYRKWFPGSVDLGQGTSVDVWDTEYGRVCMLICLDAEKTEVMTAALEQRPLFIFNPVHIPCRCSAYRNHPELLWSNWRSALMTMSRRYDFLAWENGINIIRCDAPYATGHGSSMVLTPSRTDFPATPTATTMTVLLKTAPQAWLSANQITRTRTERVDNNGTRAVVRELTTVTVEVEQPIREDVSKRHRDIPGDVLAVGFRSVDGKPKGLLCAVSMDTIRIWDGATCTLQQQISLAHNADSAWFEPRGLYFCTSHGEQCYQIDLDGGDAIEATQLMPPSRVQLQWGEDFIVGHDNGSIEFTRSGLLIQDAHDCVTCLASVPNGDILLSGGGEGRIIVWRVGVGQVEATQELLMPRGVVSMAYDYGRVLVGMKEGRVSVMHFEQNRVSVDLEML